MIAATAARALRRPPWWRWCWATVDRLLAVLTYDTELSILFERQGKTVMAVPRATDLACPPGQASHHHMKPMQVQYWPAMRAAGAAAPRLLRIAATTRAAKSCVPEEEK